MTDIADFADRVQPRRKSRRQPMDAAEGMRGLVSGLDSQAMMDSAQGADIMDAAPDTRLRGSAPVRVQEGGDEEGMVDILPGGQLRQSGPQQAPTQGGTPVQEVGLFDRIRGNVRPTPTYRQSNTQMDCSTGTCFRVPMGSVSSPMISQGQVISSGTPVISEGIEVASAPLRVGDLVKGTLQQRQFDIDPSAKVKEMPMYTPDSLFRAGMEAFDYAESRLSRGDQGAAIAAVQGYNLSKSLFAEAAVMHQDRQTFQIMEARMAAADQVVHLATPLGKLEKQAEMLSDARFTVQERATQYVATVSQQMGVEGISDGAKAEQLSALKGIYQRGIDRATGFDVTRLYLANRIDRPENQPFAAESRMEQARISRLKSLNLVDDLLTSGDTPTPLDQYVPRIREVVGRPLEQSLRAMYEAQEAENPDIRAAAEADQYALQTAQSILQRRAGVTPEQARAMVGEQARRQDEQEEERQVGGQE